MRKFKHINTGIERELKNPSPLISVLESSPSWEELKLEDPTPVAEPEEKEDPDPPAKDKK